MCLQRIASINEISAIETLINICHKQSERREVCLPPTKADADDVLLLLMMKMMKKMMM